jgi:signal transduction histidine kinase
MAGLAALIVQDVVFTTESKLRTEAQQLCTAACQDIRTQYEERTAYAGDPLRTLPIEAQEISLRVIANTVLQAYTGVKGGMYLADTDRLMGYAYPTAAARTDLQLTKAESDLLRILAVQARSEGGIATKSERRNRDLIVAAATQSNEITVWAMRRVPVVQYPLFGTHRWWLAALVSLTILGLGGIISIWYMLHSGVAAIRGGLRNLEDDFSFRLPAISGDLGQVAQAINRMAERRVMLEEKLRQQDRLAALGKVAGGVAHEVRNPLNSIQLTLQLLERRLKKGAVLTNEIQDCLQEINRLDKIVERLLAFGQPAMTNRRVQEIEPLIVQAVKMVHDPMQKKKVRIESSDVESGLSANVDGSQIIQVLINLLLNAIEASPEKGFVRLSAQNSESKIRVRIFNEGSRIPDAVRPHIFDAYFTTKPNGTGLGLAISREIVINHGGTLEFESESEGTTFIMQLPTERSAMNEA